MKSLTSLRNSRRLLLTLLALVLVAAMASGTRDLNVGKSTPVGVVAAPQMSAPGVPLAAGSGPTVESSTHVTIGHSVKNDVSQPLRDIKPLPPVASHEENEAPDNPVARFLGGEKSGPVTDRFLQERLGTQAVATPGVNFEGIQFNNFYPSDATGDIGPGHYVQWVNARFQIFTKTGTSVYGPADGRTLWAGFGGACESSNDGDPIVQYDPLAGRWLLSQFAVPGGAQGFFQCIAISQTSDPTSSYYRYAFQMSATLMNDYPKFGVWPDAYYMSIVNYDSAQNYMGPSAVAFDRARMLDGQPATFQKFDLGTAYAPILPSDLDGTNPPPPGAANVFATMESAGSSQPGKIHLWKFHVDWPTPAGSSFTALPDLLTEPFLWHICGNPREACISQGGGPYLEAITDRPMYRLAYRNYGDHEALVFNHTVYTGGVGPRWYELRNISTTPTIFQQGTFAPQDGVARWVGSIAMDHSGNIALGYSVAGAGTYPEVRYTGRLSTDPLNEMTVTEAQIADGGDSQYLGSRWGDYSTMSVDPVDDCTFWYTNQYIPAGTAQGYWKTRIASFRLPACSRDHTPTPTATSTPTVTSTPATTSSYAYLQSQGPLTVPVGSKFTLDLRVNSGTNNVVAAQNYLTFTNSILQNVDYAQPGCVVTNTVLADLNTFDTDLQNQVCNSSAPCDLGSLVAPPGSIAFASGTLFNPPAHGNFRVAQLAFCATTTGTAVIHWQFSPPAPDTRDSEVIDDQYSVVSSPALYTDIVVNVVPNGPTVTPTATATMTPSPTATAAALLVGHVTWQGRTVGTSRNQVPVTLTLKSGITEVNYPAQNTDVSGYFTVSVAGLAPGTYDYRVKGTKYLASAGQAALTGSGSTSLEMGTQRTGDGNNDNRVNTIDFNIVRNTLGKACADPGYDDRGDFNGDCLVNITDFTLLKTNFGQGGAGPLGPEHP